MHAQVSGIPEESDTMTKKYEWTSELEDALRQMGIL